MLKYLFKHKFLTKGFCNKLDLFPDQIVESVRMNIAKKDLSDLEATVINNIHFFDSDQFVDIFVTFANNDRGSARFWDLLCRKIYEYDFDISQRVALLRTNEKTLKWTDDIFQYLNQPFIRRLAREETRNALSVYEKVLY
jgi:hypothetical protein